MNNLVRVLAFVLLAFSLVPVANGQVSLLITTPDDMVIQPDTAACFDDPFTVTANVAFAPGTTDSITVPFSIKMRTPLGIFTLDSAVAIGGPAGDSVSLSIPSTYSAARFGGGVNIIVVWPETGFFPPMDSIRDTVVILCGMGIEVGSTSSGLVAFPNPSLDGHFQLSSHSPISRSAEIWVHDAAGRLVAHHPQFTQEVDLSKEAHGVYHLTVLDRQRPPIHLKLVR